MAGRDGFIARNGLWTDDQARRAAELARRVEGESLHLVRLAWADTHGASRAKAVAVPTFLEALAEGYNINVATTTLDSAGGRVFSSFTKGGGMGLDEMTGSPNLVIVPDPETFRTLPWAPGVGWVLCDEYFPDGTPFHFSTRRLLRRQIARLAERGMEHVVGLEVEWYLSRRLDDRLGEDEIALPGQRGRAPATVPVEPGYAYHSETGLDVMQPVLSELAHTFRALGLPLRSVENEFGPGQVECTFNAGEALRAADGCVLFRTATRQVCRRLGYHASFMCRPALKGHFSSGWHLHQSVRDAATGRNLFMPDAGAGGERLSALARSFLAGLLVHAGPQTVFAVPTVNGYRRFRPNSLAPDRAAWGHDHRGAMVRTLGGPGDPATRLENRLGEPAANPYLYVASQIAAGLDGIERGLEPWPADDEPYASARPKLPASLEAALAALEEDGLYRAAFGEVFVDYFLRLKRAELARFERHLAQAPEIGAEDDVTAWEHDEYYDFF